MFEKHFVCQRFDENRSIEQTLDLGWALLSLLTREELDRVASNTLEQFYKPDEAAKRFGV